MIEFILFIIVVLVVLFLIGLFIDYSVRKGIFK